MQSQLDGLNEMAEKTLPKTIEQLEEDKNAMEKKNNAKNAEIDATNANNKKKLKECEKVLALYKQLLGLDITTIEGSN